MPCSRLRALSMTTEVTGYMFSPSIGTTASVSLLTISFFRAGVKISFDQLHLNQRRKRSNSRPCCRVATETSFFPFVMRTPGPSPAADDSGTSAVSAVGGPFARFR
jgi:hypothetical protein